MGKPKVILYFDLHSPYSYLAFYILKNSPVFRACEVTYIPVLLVAFINAIGLNPPWNSPNKVKWMETDIARWSRDCNIPWKQGWPANYPFKATTMKVQRALTVCSLDCPEQYPEILSALFHAFWYEKMGVQLPEVHGPIMSKVIGEDVAAKVLQKSVSDEIKALLRRNTEDAVASGSAGLPWIKAVDMAGQEEYFWGFDHLGQVANFLGLKRPSGAHL